MTAGAAVGSMLLFPVLAIALGLPWSFLGLSGLLGSHLPILAGSLLAGWVLLVREGLSPETLGFHRGREALGEGVWGLGLGVAVVLAVVAGMTLMGGVRWGLEEGSPGAALGAAAGVLAVLVIPAAAEEALLRGYLFQLSAREWGWVPTLAWTSGAFALLHGGNPALGAVALANLLLAGVVLGLLVLRTGSLWWATGAHLGWNWGQAALDLPVSGLDLVDVPLLAPGPAGPAWLGGGGFGVEGSVVATVALVGASAWLWRGGGRGWIRPSPRLVELGAPVLVGRAAGDRRRWVGGEVVGRVASPPAGVAETRTRGEE